MSKLRKIELIQKFKELLNKHYETIYEKGKYFILEKLEEKQLKDLINFYISYKFTNNMIQVNCLGQDDRFVLSIDYYSFYSIFLKWLNNQNKKDIEELLNKI